MTKATGKTKVEEQQPQVVINQIAAETVQVPIIGTAPLLVHAFGEKAKRQMLDAMQGRKTPKQAKDPEAEYEAAFYRLKDGRPGFPAIAFKSATVGGCRFFGKDISMTAARQFFFFRGEPGSDGRQMVAIEGEPVMREDPVRVGNKGSDLRYRPQFTEWSATLVITYVTSVISRDSLLSLIDAGGMGVGVGEWRPERRGDFGTYCIDTTKDLEVLS